MPHPEVGGVDLELHRLRGQLHESARVIRELTEAVAARDAFIAAAGRELRNPMGAVVLDVSHLLCHAQAGTAPAWLVPRLESLDRQARRFVRRATTLLDVSRMATGKATLDRSLVRLSDVVHDVARDLEPEARRALCHVTLDVEPGVVGLCDPVAVEQIAFTLLSNAIKYGAGHPVAVTLTSDASTVSLEVRDHGAGISHTARRRIFDRFERVAQRSLQPGFGLGLWIARLLVEGHAGDFHVESAPGRGSCFTARLPRGIPEPQP